MCMFMSVFMVMMVSAGVVHESVGMGGSSVEHFKQDDVDDNSAGSSDEHDKGFLDELLVDDARSGLDHHHDDQVPYDE